MANELAVLSDRLRRGEQLITGWITLPEPALAGELLHVGFDLVTLDMQHGLFDFVAAARGIESARLAGGAALVRIPVGDFALASRLLDAGATGVIAPMINSAADAERFASFIKFPPLGERSWGPYRALRAAGSATPDYLAGANRWSLGIAMIETAEALAALDDILAVDGIDGVLVGPNDLSIALSKGAVVDAGSEAVDAALTKVVERAKAHGKTACTFCVTPERAREMFARGFAICAAGNDIHLIKAGAQALLTIARPPIPGQ